MHNMQSKRAGLIRTLALLWLVFLGAFALGAYVVASQTWPYPLIAAVQAFVAGDAGEDTTLVDKLINDLGITPARHVVDSQLSYPIPSHYRSLEGLPLNPRRAAPRMFLADQAPAGYRLIYGTFDFVDGLHGAILLDPAGRVARVWTVSQEQPGALRNDANVFPHGLEIARDGSLVVAFDGGSSLTRYGYCGEEIWRTPGTYHHAVTFDGPDALWSWGTPPARLAENGEYLVKVDFQTGEVMSAVHMDDVVGKNPDIDIFGIAQEDGPEGSTWLFDRWHANDIDPLPAAYAEQYPDFQAGDLLISFRAVDLVFVLDPVDHRVKWWRQGLTRRQHDPDWNARGTITIFDNNMHRDYSRVVEIDPRTYVHQTVVDGAAYQFYTWHRGKHDRSADGGYLVTSTTQGRVFEVNSAGEIDFEFINRYEPNGRFLALSEARFLEPDFFEELPECE